MLNDFVLDINKLNSFLAAWFLTSSVNIKIVTALMSLISVVCV
jgi:hypothetical protein